MTEQQLNSGETLIWEKEKEIQSPEEFVDFISNGLNLHYGYDHIVAAVNEGELLFMAACKGKIEAGLSLYMFVNMGLEVELKVLNTAFGTTKN